MPATTWTKLTAPETGTMDSIPAIFPITPRYKALTAYVLMEILVPQTRYIAIRPPSSQMWGEASIAATSYTEESVASTSWTEKT